VIKKIWLPYKWQQRYFNHHTNGDRKWVAIANQEILIIGW